MEWLADKTGGKTYFVRDSDTSAAFCDAFSGALTIQASVPDGELRFKLYESKITHVPPFVFYADFSVDKTVGHNMKLTVFNLENRGVIDYLKLIGPGGNVVDRVKYETNTAHITVPSAEVIAITEVIIQVELKMIPNSMDNRPENGPSR